jgi:hypothetical protein
MSGWCCVLLCRVALVVGRLLALWPSCFWRLLHRELHRVDGLNGFHLGTNQRRSLGVLFQSPSSIGKNSVT